MKKWAVIDLETTGVDAAIDEIIDIGYYLFEEHKLVKVFQSLVRPRLMPSAFIQKLTGITPDDLKNAPLWKDIQEEIQSDLEGAHLIAHNAQFEQKFLEHYLSSSCYESLCFSDSLLFLALLRPDLSKLSLENYIIEYQVAEFEEHRALSDARDLFRVLCVSTQCLLKQSEMHDPFTQFKERLNELCLEHHENFHFHYFLDQISYDIWQTELLNSELKLKTPSEIEALIHQIQKKSLSLDIYDEMKMSDEQNDNEKDSRPIDPHRCSDQAQENANHSLQQRKTKVLSPENLEYFFRERMSQLEGMKLREAQVKMSYRVAQGLKNSVHTMIQAPTGTGKTLGYLIPSALFTLEKKTPVVIATATKSLQDQVLSQDLPVMFKILDQSPRDLKVTKYIGANNHLCALQLERYEQSEQSLFDDGFEGHWVELYINQFMKFNQQRPSQIISKDQISFVLKKLVPRLNEVLADVAVDSKACIGRRCKHFKNCTYTQSLEHVKESNIIITNHALMLSWPRSLEPISHIVIDEAHKLEMEATSAFTRELHEQDLAPMLKKIITAHASAIFLCSHYATHLNSVYMNSRQDIQQSAEDFLTIWRDLKECLHTHLLKRKNYSEKYSNEFLLNWGHLDQNSDMKEIYFKVESLFHISKLMFDALAPLRDKESLKLSDIEQDNDDLKAFNLYQTGLDLSEFLLDLMKALFECPDGWVQTLNFQEDKGMSCSHAPIDVGRELYQNFFEHVDTSILTSATLKSPLSEVGTQALEWTSGYNLFDPSKRFQKPMYLDNDFNYSQNVKAFLIKEGPSLYSEDYVGFILELGLPVTKHLGGRSLYLFSSKVRFQKACDAFLTSKLFDGEVFIQGMGKDILEDFKKSKNAILVGMESFAEGIDISGDALQLVVIDKVPDLTISSLIDQRRQVFDREFGSEFQEYYLSHRARSLHQKLGRLMRKETDRGVAIVVDTRLSRWKKHTLGQFKGLMKPYEFQECPVQNVYSQSIEFLN